MATANLDTGVTDPDGTTYDEFDTAAAVVDIGNELFPKDEGNTGQLEEGEELPLAGPEVKTPVEGQTVALPIDPTKPAIVPGENKEPLSLPKSWKKDMAPVWEKMPPEAKAYAVEREAQFMRGFQQYQNGHNAWSALVQPFAPVLEANPNVNPIQLMQGLLATHLTLLNPQQPAAEKAAMVQGLLSDYGIKLDGITALPEDFTKLQQRVTRAEADNATLREQMRRDVAANYQAGVNQHLTEVEKFSADPKNEYFGEVGNDILRLIRADSRITLAEAYETACWANPVVRVKMIAEQQSVTQAATTQPRAKNGKFVNLDDNASVVIKPKAKTIDDTINGIVAKHYESTKH